MSPGDFAMYQGELKVRIVRLMPEGKAIIAVGSDTQVVEATSLTSAE